MRYQVKQAANGKFLVIDGKVTVAAGMTEGQAQVWADRLNLRAIWGK